LPYNTLLPIFAKVIFKGDAATFGYINSFLGLGALTGTFFLASLKPGTDRKKVLFAAAVILGIALTLFSHISSFPVAMVFAVLSGFGTMSMTTTCITIVQVESDKNMRGRVMSYVALGYFGMLPLGSVLTGFISQQMGAPNALLLQGITSLVIAAIFFKFLMREKPDKKTIVQSEKEDDIIAESI